MLLELRTVGRKTPRDGRLDVGDTTYRRLAIISALSARVGEATAPARLERMPCSRCEAHAASAGEHLFLVSEVFKGLVPGETCVVELQDDGVTVEVARPHPLDPTTPPAAPPPPEARA